MVNPSAVVNMVDTLVGKTPWGLRRGVGTFLTMEFGAAMSDSREKFVHGEWHLWLYNCVWRMEERDKIVLSSGDDFAKIDNLLQTLKLEIIRQIQIDDISLDL